MIIYLFGPDSYRRQQKLNEIIETYQEKHSVFSVENFDLDTQDDFFRFKDYYSQETLFAVKKMAVIKNSSEIKDKNGFLDELKNLLKSLISDESTIIILSQNKEFNKDFDFLLKKPVNSQEFKNLEPEKFEFFIAKEAKVRSIDLSPKAVEFLARIFKGNSWGVITEMEKLSLLSPNKEIGVEDIKKYVFWMKAPDIYDFTDSITRNKTLGQKLNSLENLFLAIEEPAKIFNFLSANPFLNLNLLKSMADYDVLIKSGKLDYETALLDLCLN